MSSVKISNLPEVTQLNDQCCVPIVSQGQTKKMTYGDLCAHLSVDLPMPKATSSTVGGVKVGSGLTVEADGTLHTNADPGALFISVTEDEALTVPSYAHMYVVLAFDTIVHNVTFTPSEGGTISWVNGEPTFEASCVYEISFLNLSAIWLKR